MSYSIGQFRTPQLSSYSVALSMALDKQQTTGVSSEDLIFYNACGNLTGTNIVDNQNCYYLQFGVYQRSDSTQTFYLKLRNSAESEDNEQLIETYTVSSGTGVTYFEVIISPNASYDQILWELQRTPLDYTMTNADGSYGRKMSVVINTFTRLIDVLNTLKSTYSDMEYLTKIGIQGPSGLLMCINREPIRIGRNGIYEINNGIDITSVSFVTDSTTYFIMDFEY